jgi:hypothetical protein
VSPLELLRAAARLASEVTDCCWLAVRTWWDVHRGGWWLINQALTPVSPPRPKETR